MAVSEPFVWGPGGSQMTPEAIAAQRKIAQAMMQRGGDYSPVQSPWQGVARVAEGLMGGLDARAADAAEKRNATAEKELLASLIPGAAATPTAATAPAPAPAPAAAAPAAIPAGKESFVSTMMPLAEAASAKTGVDPRIIVAQAALESGWGKSAPGNNYFGIKSHGQPGGTVMPTTEVVNGQPVRTTDSFRAYASPEESAAGYADFINKNPRYGALKSAQGLDAQVAALGQSGYATDPNYAAKIASIAKSLPAPAAATPTDPAAIPPNAQPAQGFAVPGQPSPAVTQVAQAAPSGPNPRLLAAMASPYVSEGTKKVLGIMLAQQMKGNDATNDIKEFNAENALRAKRGLPPLDSLRDFQIDLKKAGATRVTTNVDKGEDSFAKAAGTAQAKRFDELAGEGQKARQMVSDIDTLTELGKNIGTGKGAEITANIGPWAESIGVPIKGLSDIQAFEAIVNRVAPSLRVPGSGAQSDFELKNFLKSLPALGNTPEGNAISAATMKGLQENKIRASEIGSKALNGEITRPQAEKMLRELPDPMEGYRAYVKANKVNQPAPAKTAPAIPQAGEIRDGYRFKGGNPADQKNWEQIS